jgi:GH15 family glucan-1,4-alpha-glucosidase
MTAILPADDPRLIATVDAMADRLTQDGLVLRYSTGGVSTDGLAGGEEYDVKNERMVGDCPQAFSHIGLLAAARALISPEPGHGQTPLPRLRRKQAR